MNDPIPFNGRRPASLASTSLATPQHINLGDLTKTQLRRLAIALQAQLKAVAQERNQARVQHDKLFQIVNNVITRDADQELRVPEAAFDVDVSTLQFRLVVDEHQTVIITVQTKEETTDASGSEGGKQNPPEAAATPRD